MRNPVRLNYAQAYRQAVSIGIETGDWSQLQFWYVNEFEDKDGFSEQIFSYICQLLNDSNFLNASGSHNVLRYLEYDWDILTTTQKEKLLPFFESSYFRFSDTLSWFLISEFLGLLYCNEEAFSILCKLSSGPIDNARALVAMGFFNIVENSTKKELQEKSRAMLAHMKNDVSPIVRSETEGFLKQLLI